ncbi:GspIIEN domain protein [Syntrophotalea carbinolica DSM 2380]|uniref:GspIIEN domain protein n=1 Tax=Syntrophotalea carbinolica (strain DSM 2380 / NBRC 103641 / GraBd1) TaxID=338963 RepID=Q39ZZ5_SYNC1|nr:GspIIEN domain-containing protein [Syntrophotalea carbinolica]ABA90312.1 GspIIEN domain protein [Syntrophotalea carbinolica DSM 2380]
MASNLLKLLVRTGMLPKNMAAKVQAHARHAGIAASTSTLILIPLGEDRLAQLLSRQLDLPCFEPRQLQNLPPVMREFLSMEQALKFRALPIRLGQQGLVVAMADPSDRENMQALASLIGYPLAPLVAPECRLIQAIERCYDRQLPDREQLLLEKMRPAAAMFGPPVEEDIDEAMLEEAEVIDDEIPPKTAITLAELSEKLAAARCRDDVADTLIDHLSGQFDRMGLFLLKNGELRGWRALVGHRLHPEFHNVKITVTGSNLLHAVLSEQNPFLGRVPEPRLLKQLVNALGASCEKAIMLPLILAGRSVGMLFAEEAGQTGSERVTELQNLLAKTACALEILILRNKLTRP